jgi:hypothetical protein
MFPIIPIVATLIVAGLALWLIQAFLPLDPKIKQLITAVVIVGAVLYILSAFGLFDGYYHHAAAPAFRPC